MTLKPLSKQGKINKLYWAGRGDSDNDENGIIETAYCGIQGLFDSPALSSGIDHIFYIPFGGGVAAASWLKIKSMLNAGNIKGLYKLIRRWDTGTTENINILADHIRSVYKNQLAGVK